jgi:tyrosine-protein phosphatase SIW14
MIDVYRILKDVLNQSYQPLLIHCNKGKHRTGSIVGCIRKIRSWALTSVINEYYMFAMPKARFEDQIFIESFDLNAFRQFEQEQEYRDHTRGKSSDEKKNS